MNEFFTEYPQVIKHPHTSSEHHQVKPTDWQAADNSLQVDRTVDDVAWAIPGKIFCHEEIKSIVFC
jgi:deoxyribodipyrimidine photo-lyase